MNKLIELAQKNKQVLSAITLVLGVAVFSAMTQGAAPVQAATVDGECLEVVESAATTSGQGANSSSTVRRRTTSNGSSGGNITQTNTTEDNSINTTVNAPVTTNTTTTTNFAPLVEVGDVSVGDVTGDVTGVVGGVTSTLPIL